MATKVLRSMKGSFDRTASGSGKKRARRQFGHSPLRWLFELIHVQMQQAWKKCEQGCRTTTSVDIEVVSKVSMQIEQDVSASGRSAVAVSGRTWRQQNSERVGRDSCIVAMMFNEKFVGPRCCAEVLLCGYTLGVDEMDWFYGRWTCNCQSCYSHTQQSCKFTKNLSPTIHWVVLSQDG